MVMKFIPLLIAMFIYWCPFEASAQKLKAFEKDATKKRSSSSNSSRDKDNSSSDNDYDSVGEFIASSLIQAGGSLIVGGLAGLAGGWMKSGTGLSQQGWSEMWELGESRQPFARLDVDYQDVDAGIDAVGLMAEAGYGPFALLGRQTRFTEDVPAEAGGGKDRLRVTQGYIAARALFESGLGINLGLGGLSLDGEDSNNGFSFTTPIQFRFNQHAGVEVRPAWAHVNGRTITEWDIALLGGIKHADVKVGWRRLESPNLELHGFYAGLSLRW